jgi:hypothetical protein
LLVLRGPTDPLGLTLALNVTNAPATVAAFTVYVGVEAAWL